MHSRVIFLQDALDEVHPRTRYRCVVDMDVRVLGEPLPYLLVLMRGIVVRDEFEGKLRGHLPFHFLF